MSPWIVAATLMAAALVPCGVAIARGETGDGLASIQCAGTITTMILLLIAEATARASSADLALASAVLSVPSGLVFAHFLERWL